MPEDMTEMSTVELTCKKSTYYEGLVVLRNSLHWGGFGQSAILRDRCSLSTYHTDIEDSESKCSNNDW